MARIKIEDLPVMEDIDTQESKGIFGGGVIIEHKPWSRRGHRRGRFAGLDRFGQRGIIIMNKQSRGKKGGGLKGFTELE